MTNSKTNGTSLAANDKQLMALATRTWKLPEIIEQDIKTSLIIRLHMVYEKIRWLLFTIQIHRYIYMCVLRYICMYVCVCNYTHIIYICKYTYVGLLIYIYVCVCVFMLHVCICLRKFVEAHICLWLHMYLSNYKTRYIYMPIHI